MFEIKEDKETESNHNQNIFKEVLKILYSHCASVILYHLSLAKLPSIDLPAIDLSNIKIEESKGESKTKAEKED